MAASLKRFNSDTNARPGAPVRIFDLLTPSAVPPPVAGNGPRIRPGRVGGAPPRRGRRSRPTGRTEPGCTRARRHRARRSGPCGTAAQPRGGERADDVRGGAAHAAQQLGGLVHVVEHPEGDGDVVGVLLVEVSHPLAPRPARGLGRLHRASATIAGAGSSPVTWTPRAASGSNSGPLPHPTSRTRRRHASASVDRRAAGRRAGPAR